LQIARHLFPALGPFEQYAEIVEFADERVAKINFFTQAAATLQRLLRLGLIGPEVCCCDALLYRSEFESRIGGVKDSSVDL
jgi:hypothetical protein